ncbi:universal stress protein [Natrinema salifodinae]|uniref:Nucleotide-binding universal stress protein, UspA family n=1 Tax=Natrinema salifodinae TaxID=1202768 RepID=A0A1I0Q4Z3_9EURY|nr:universal stress protein [Natrinema salifodinae]SEW21638.1 Nucleotide-binding universal stress protein, UspA family [Natrinema salifodinae]
MLDRVLVPMDGSEMSKRALEYALENHPDADVTVLSVVAEPSVMMGDAMSIAFEDDIEEAAEERAEAVFDRARELAADYDTEIGTAVAIGRPARAIVSRAEDYDAVVMGSHGGNMVDRLFVGDVAETVFKRSPVPVTIVR